MKNFPLLICLIFLLTLSASAQTDNSLSDTILILDPGHGDKATRFIAEDPGAIAQTSFGEVCECVFTWDTAMRLKEAAEQRGATVFLTTRDSRKDYQPKDWTAEDFPQPGSLEFPFKTLVDRPEPITEWDVLTSRVETANRVYQDHAENKDVIFLSLHFDSTNPDLEGISFYYPTWCKPQPTVATLKSVIREQGRARRSLTTGKEVGLAKAYKYAVLSRSNNPDSYLVELGNMRSSDQNGDNPDLWRMRSPEHRQQYAELLVEVLEKRERNPRPFWPKSYLLLGLGFLVMGYTLIRRSKRF